MAGRALRPDRSQHKIENPVQTENDLLWSPFVAHPIVPLDVRDRWTIELISQVFDRISNKAPVA